MALSSWSALSYSSISAQGAAALVISGMGNSISHSTLSAVSSGVPALAILGASSNTVTNCRMENPAWNAVYISSGVYNSIRYSTMTSNASGAAALTVWRASWTTLSQSYAFNPADHGALFAYAAWSTIEGSTLTSAGTGYGLRISGAYNTVSASRIRRAGIGGNANLILRSTITSEDSEGLFVDGSSLTVANCYIQGASTGALLAGSTATLISDSVLSATDIFGTGLVLLGPSALYASGGNQGVSVASTTLLAGTGGTGALLDADNQGTLSLASVTVRGARFGVRIATPGAGGAFHAP